MTWGPNIKVSALNLNLIDWLIKVKNKNNREVKLTNIQKYYLLVTKEN